MQQREQILKLQEMQQEFKTMTRSEKSLRARTGDMIQIDGLQKIKELDTEDRYKVLEFLVKEMMMAKEENPNLGGHGSYTVQYNRDHEMVREKRSYREKDLADRRYNNTQQ